MNGPTTTSCHYANCLMLSREGIPLSTISEEKVRWYMSRGLATEVKDWEDKRFGTVIRLNFMHKGKDKAREADLQHVENQCVVCGEKHGLALHHVIPYRVKRFYAAEDKDHTRAQCVLLCSAHHKMADALTEHIEDPHKRFTEFAAFWSKVFIKAISWLRYPYFKLWLWRRGGVRGLNGSYIDAFMTLQPRYLPKGWLDKND